MCLDFFVLSKVFEHIVHVAGKDRENLWIFLHQGRGCEKVNFLSCFSYSSSASPAKYMSKKHV